MSVIRLPKATFTFAVCMSLTACGGAPADRALNTESVERDIETSIRAQRSLEVDVSCPSGVPFRRGARFTCVAYEGRKATRLEATQIDDRGRVHFKAQAP